MVSSWSANHPSMIIHTHTLSLFTPQRDTAFVSREQDDSRTATERENADLSKVGPRCCLRDLSRKPGSRVPRLFAALGGQNTRQLKTSCVLARDLTASRPTPSDEQPAAGLGRANHRRGGPHPDTRATGPANQCPSASSGPAGTGTWKQWNPPPPLHPSPSWG